MVNTPNDQITPIDTTSEIYKELIKFRINSLKYRVYKLILENPDGIPSENIIACLNLTNVQLYDAKHKINRTAKYKIILKSGRYFIDKLSTPIDQQTALPLPITNNDIKISSDDSDLNSESDLPTLKTSNKSENKIIDKSLIEFFPKNYLNRIKDLPTSDMNDVLDMLKKSIYYRKSAEALINANEMINKINIDIIN